MKNPVMLVFCGGVLACQILGFLPAPVIAAPAKPASQAGLIDLNLATKEQLMSLPGVGEEEAGKIIDGRPYSEKMQLLKREILPSRVFYPILDKTTIDIKAFNDTGQEKDKKEFLSGLQKTLKAPKLVKARSGLKYLDLQPGTGRVPQKGKKVRVHYTGWLQDGTKFDSSLDREKPIMFTLGTGEVIKGWDEGLASMKVGGKRRLIIPAKLGYGEKGAGGKIPPNADLVFDVELIDAEP
ncbi:FKBP-type peptidyl-prolyl cis-trans isomerase [Geomonas nitrogeniifigens]|nr:FKBP-type peptidyl-prolyl cis-trans isomerase [Geomonas nitrogeniifigens]